MTRSQRSEAEIERLLAGGELQVLTGGAADGGQWLSKARRTLSTTAHDADSVPVTSSGPVELTLQACASLRLDGGENPSVCPAQASTTTSPSLITTACSPTSFPETTRSANTSATRG
jgi:hypothetical protein